MTKLDITWDPAKARTNLDKHGISFADAASVLLDPLALTIFDAAHSLDEERWFTLGTSTGGALLALAHTFQTTGPRRATVRLISRATLRARNADTMKSARDDGHD